MASKEKGKISGTAKNILTEPVSIKMSVDPNKVIAASIDEGPHTKSVAPTTTAQEDITTAGQRKVNLIWEYTQAFIAITVILSNMIAGILYAFNGKTENIPAVLSSSLFLVIGFYFSRTNHAAIGGVGKKPDQAQEYKGR